MVGVLKLLEYDQAFLLENGFETNYQDYEINDDGLFVSFRKENLNLNFSRGKIITRFPDSYIPATIPIPLGARACLITSGGKY